MFEAMVTRAEHMASPGRWPAEFPLRDDGTVEVGLIVQSLSGEIEGRTTGGRSRCRSTGCPGWFIYVSWETGQSMQICSEGWTYDPASRGVRVTGGGEISARFVSPPPLGVPPASRSDWPTRESLATRKGWRVKP